MQEQNDENPIILLDGLYPMRLNDFLDSARGRIYMAEQAKKNVLPNWAFYAEQTPPPVGSHFVVTAITDNVLDLGSGERISCVTLDALHGDPVAAADAPGWWAFEGSEWESKALYLVDGVETPWQERWNEEADDHWNQYELNLYEVHRYIDVKGPVFRSLLDVRWVTAGMSFCYRHGSGPHRGEPVLGFVSPKYTWNPALYGLDTLVGNWWKLTLPWKEE